MKVRRDDPSSQNWTLTLPGNRTRSWNWTQTLTGAVTTATPGGSTRYCSQDKYCVSCTVRCLMDMMSIFYSKNNLGLEFC